MHLTLHTRVLLLVAGVAALTACDPGDARITVSGTAAAGAPLADARVLAHCRAGVGASARTDGAGRWSATLPERALPCALRVVSAGGDLHLYGIALPGGEPVTANVSLLTTLVVAGAAGVPGDAWFDALDDAALAGLAQQAAPGVERLRGALSARGYTPPADFDPLRMPFNAARGDAHDELLEQVAVALSDTGLDLAGLLGAYAVQGALAIPAPLPAGAGATGSLQVTYWPGAEAFTFAPNNGVDIRVSQSEPQHRALTFRSLSSRLADGGATPVVEAVALQSFGGNVLAATYYRADGERTLEASCITALLCSGAGTRSPADSAVFPASFLFDEFYLTGLGANARFNGTLQVNPDALTLAALALPPAWAGDIRLDGSPQTVRNFVGGANESAGFTLSLAGQPTSIGINEEWVGDGVALVATWFVPPATEGGAPKHYRSAPGAGLSLVESADRWQVVFDQLVLTNAFDTGDSIVIDGIAQHARALGHLQIEGVGLFPVDGGGIRAVNDRRILSAGGAPGLQGYAGLEVEVRDGAVLRASLEEILPPNYVARSYECGRHALLRHDRTLPACTGMTLGADGRTVTLVDTSLVSRSGSTEPRRLSGTLVAPALLPD